jgi:hypothetical protein
MVDAEAIGELARRRGTSESEAVRDAVAQALAWEGMADALEELGRLGAFSDTERVEAMYGPLPRSVEPEHKKPTRSRGPSRARFRTTFRGERVIERLSSPVAETDARREPDGAPPDR